MKTLKDFSDLIRTEMKEQNLKDKELAEISGVSESVIYGVKNMYNFPQTSNLLKILDSLGYDIALVQKDIGL